MHTWTGFMHLFLTKRIPSGEWDSTGACMKLLDTVTYTVEATVS
jgi:hypothetical protein